MVNVYYFVECGWRFSPSLVAFAKESEVYNIIIWIINLLQLNHTGYNFIIVSNQEIELNAVREELQKSNNNQDIIPITIDLSSMDSAKAIYEEVRDKRVDILINNAGIVVYGDFVDMPEEKIAQKGIFDINKCYTLKPVIYDTVIKW